MAVSELSNAQLIRQLEVGESFTLSKRLETAKATPASIKKAADQLHNIGRSAMARASHLAKVYKGETGEWMTTDKNVVVFFLVTRTE